jgi:predicted dehydrogenase
MDKIRWGILGVAKINERWLPGFRSATNADLAAIASRDTAKARKAAADAGIAKSFSRYEDLLADPEIDAVYLPLPNSLHSEWAKKAADAGKHVLCEKPLAPTAKEAADIAAYCRSKGVRLMDGFMWPHHERTARIRQIIDSGGIGEVISASGAFTFLLDLMTPNIRLQPNMGGGSLLDVGCYPVTAIRWALRAEPERVYATAKLRNGVDLSMKGILFFADGRTAMFDCGFTLPMRQWFEIVGTEGVIYLPDMWLPDARGKIYIQHGEQAIEDFDVGGRDQIACMIEEFGRAIQEKRDPKPSADEGVKTLKVLDALAKSARTGQAVDVA